MTRHRIPDSHKAAADNHDAMHMDFIRRLLKLRDEYERETRHYVRAQLKRKLDRLQADFDEMVSEVDQ